MGLCQNEACPPLSERPSPGPLANIAGKAAESSGLRRNLPLFHRRGVGSLALAVGGIVRQVFPQIRVEFARGQVQVQSASTDAPAKLSKRRARARGLQYPCECVCSGRPGTHIGGFLKGLPSGAVPKTVFWWVSPSVLSTTLCDRASCDVLGGFELRVVSICGRRDCELALDDSGWFRSLSILPALRWFPCSPSRRDFGSGASLGRRRTRSWPCPDTGARRQSGWRRCRSERGEDRPPAVRCRCRRS